MKKLFTAKVLEKLTLKEYLESFAIASKKLNYLIDTKKVKINNTVITNKDYILNISDKITIDIDEFETIDYEPIYFELNILYEDDYILVIDKPNGYPIYDETRPSIANFVRYYYETTSQNHMIRHVHRLDIETTGCLIFAKDFLTQAKLSSDFSLNNVKKEYFALVFGIINTSGEINAPIGKDRHRSNHMIISKTGKEAITRYKLHKQYRNFATVDIKLLTGRTHQIRVHFASIKHPLVGDKQYGSSILADRVMLHSHYVSFNHPVKKERLNIEAPIPQDMKNIIKKEEKYEKN